MELMIILMILSAYLIGSCASAILVARLFGLPDPRSSGSNNPGATNVFRLGGRIPAIIVFMFDLLKGTVMVYGAYRLGIEPFWLGVIGIAVCLGHMYPIFYGFSGGKGVATAFGCLFPLGLPVSLSLLAVWLITYRLFRFSSLAALVTVCFAPITCYWFKPEYTLAVSMLAALIVWRHHANIARLLQGSEPKV